MAYTPPSVRVSSIANSRIINLSDAVRIPAIVGTGPARRTIVDYPIVRGSLRYDLLPTSGSASDKSVTLTRVAAYPGAASSDLRWQKTSTPLHYNTSGSSGAIYWAQSETAGVGKPLLGETYYVSYTYKAPASQFEPQLFTDSKDVQAFYGTEDNGIKASPLGGSGSISIAANLALQNGAPAVMCLQIQNNVASVTSSATWSAAFEKLKRKENIGFVVPLCSGSAIKTACHTAAILHVNQESNPDTGHEQFLIIGASADKSVSAIETELAAVSSRRVIYMVPGKQVTRTTTSGKVITLDGAWAGAALAGSLSALTKPVIPITGREIVGLTIPDQQYTPFELNRMGLKGACILEAKAGIVKVRHALTTDPTSAATSEISVVAGDDYVRRVTRTKLTQRFIGKGLLVDDTTLASVAASVRTIWSAMARDGFIAGFGTKNDPTTGEVPISARRNAADPTRVDVTGSVQLLFPLNYITVEFFITV